jgi:AcrR family transcriptional regulator
MITKWRNGEVMSSFSTSSTSSKSIKSSYHHGDLRQLLMGLALDHIASRGTKKLSLRALARDANVSPTAPFRHFPNKHALFAALATEGFQKLEARVKEVAQSSEPVERRLLATAVTYVGFAQENPVAYQLMFGAVLGDLSEFEGLDAAAIAARPASVLGPVLRPP